MAVFDYSDELKNYFYRHAKDREKTRRLLQETWPTAEILWPDDTGVNLKVSETAMGDAARLLNAELAEAHERLDLFLTVLEFQSITDEGLGSGASYRLVIDRGHVPEIYLYRVEGGEFVPMAYSAENRLGGVIVSSVLGAISLILTLFVTRGKGKLGAITAPGLRGNVADRASVDCPRATP